MDVNYAPEEMALRTNDQIPVSGHLVAPSTQSAVRAEDRPLADLLAVQEDRADRIAQTVASKIVPKKR
jgi:TolB-like protein